MMYSDSPISPIKGEVFVPSDKSLIHRAIFFGSIAYGLTSIKSRQIGRDNLASIRVMQSLGVDIRCKFNSKIFQMSEEEGVKNSTFYDNDIADSTCQYCCEITIIGRGLPGLKKAENVLYCGNSGTTARILLGVLAAANLPAEVDGDDSLRKRPFGRVTKPLGLMGAEFSRDTLPLSIKTGVSKGLLYESPKASAQVKSAILVAGLGLLDRNPTDKSIAKEQVISPIPSACLLVKIKEPFMSRDHTEIMFNLMSFPLNTRSEPDGSYSVAYPLLESNATAYLTGTHIDVAGDFSSAAFIMALASLVPGSDVRLKDVGFNSTRIGFYNLLIKMGANIEVINPRVISGENVADLIVKHAPLSGIDVSPEEVVYAIDEIPILAVCAAFATGETTIRGAEELRVKESDRLKMMSSMLTISGIHAEELVDGMRIIGRADLLANQRNTDISDGDEYLPLRIKNPIFSSPGDHLSLKNGRYKKCSCSSLHSAFLPESSTSVALSSRSSNLDGTSERESRISNAEVYQRFAHCGDHRIAMSAAILYYLLSAELKKMGEKEIETSFPGFYDTFLGLICANM